MAIYETRAAFVANDLLERILRGEFQGVILSHGRYSDLKERKNFLNKAECSLLKAIKITISIFSHTNLDFTKRELLTAQ